jgi:phage-related holin
LLLIFLLMIITSIFLKLMEERRWMKIDIVLFYLRVNEMWNSCNAGSKIE